MQQCTVSNIFLGVTHQTLASRAQQGAGREGPELSEREKGQGNRSEGKEKGDHPPTIFSLKVALSM